MSINARDILMRHAFSAEAERALARAGHTEVARETVGLEVEYSVVKAGTCELVGQETRDRIIPLEPELLTQELGAWQLELRTLPVDLAAGGLRAVEAVLSEAEARAVRAAALCGAELVRIGSFPLCRLDQIRRTQVEKYLRVPQWHDERHCAATPSSIGWMHNTGPAGADVVSLMNSVQFNLAVPTQEEAIRLLNLSLSLSPLTLAVAGNAQFLNGVDTGYADVRMRAWELTHDTRTPIERVAGVPTRVGLPHRYFRSMDDYFNFISSFPTVLQDTTAAFEISIGLNWLDARLKFRNEVILLEFRPISVQPSARQDIAVFAFYLGLLRYYQGHDFELPPLSWVRHNRMAAMQSALSAEFFVPAPSGGLLKVPARNLVAEYIERAEAGLAESGLGVDAEFLTVLRKRLERASTPADDFSSSVRRSMAEENRTLDDALKRAVRSCVVRIP